MMKHILTIGLLIFTVKCVTLPGGQTQQDPSEYTNTAWKAVSAINNQTSDSGSSYYFVPIKVLNATTQVVAGTSTNLEVLVGESSCKKGALQATQVTSTNCQVKQGGSRAIYKVNIWEKPWENFEQITATKVRDVSANETF